MGIGTLIIFIATILVAAVAAGVIISTSGVLQQKALLIGDQSQSRLINGIQITHIFMEGDVVEKTANNIEILARPEPASGPINFRTTSLSFFTPTGSYSATLSHRAMIERELTPDVPITGTWIPFGDLDGDGISDQMRLDTATNSLQFNFSRTGGTDLIELPFDITSGGQNVTVEDLIITDGEFVRGYVHIRDDSTSANQLDAGSVTITDEFRGDCSFEKLRPETRYCTVTMVGNDDAALEYGETVWIYFRLTEQNRLSENTQFEIKLFPQDGRSTYVLNRVPPVIYQTRMRVYP